MEESDMDLELKNGQMEPGMKATGKITLRMARESFTMLMAQSMTVRKSMRDW